LKVYFERKEKIFAGLNNGIYYDEKGKPISSLHFLLSKDICLSNLAILQCKRWVERRS